MIGDRIRRGDEDTVPQRDNHLKTHGEHGRLQAEEKPTLILGFQPPGQGEHNFLLFNPLSLWYLIMAAPEYRAPYTSAGATRKGGPAKSFVHSSYEQSGMGRSYTHH